MAAKIVSSVEDAGAPSVIVGIRAVRLASVVLTAVVGVEKPLIKTSLRLRRGMMEPRDFLLTTSRFQGKFTLENLMFDANLQELTQRVNYICGLEAKGKISLKEAYNQIEVLFEVLERYKQQLGIDQNSFEDK